MSTGATTNTIAIIDVTIIDQREAKRSHKVNIIKVCSAVIVMQPQLFIVIARDPTNVE